MDTFNSNQVPPMPGSPLAPTPKKSGGALIAVIVILLLIVIGGMYFLGQRMNQNGDSTTESDNIAESLRTQGSGDDLDSIEADLNATQVDNLDQGAAAIEAELN